MIKHRLSLLVVGSFLCCQLATAQDKPNIIYILADDLGYGDIEPYGQKKIKTPNLSRMANEGMRFTRHYAGTSVCAPSRAVLLTGLHAGHSEIRGNKQDPSGGQRPLSDSAITVAEVLKQGGYTTGMIGKWGLGEPGTSGDPQSQGFDFYYGYTDQVLAHNHFPEYLLRNGRKEYLTNKVTYLDSTLWHKGRGSVSSEKNEFADELFTREALEFISDNKQKNFFLYLPYIIPHDNGEAKEGEEFEVPSQGIYEKKPWRNSARNYASSISLLDQYVGRILDHLKALGIEKRTLVIFTSDNGPKDDELGFDSNGGLRGAKRDLYEGGIRVPFIAWWPGKVKPATVTDHVSAFWDFLPTAAEIASSDCRCHSDGISFLPVLLGSPSQQQHQALYFEIHEKQKGQAVIQGDWKIVRNFPEGKVELYHLATDVKEEKDVAASHPQLLAQMKKLLVDLRSPSADFQLPIDTNSK